MECELLRERGLWGPPIGSHLDKWMLEMTEGPCRMRKKMVRNDMFYNHYPYVPETEQETSVAVSPSAFVVAPFSLLVDDLLGNTVTGGLCLYTCDITMRQNTRCMLQCVVEPL